MGYDARGDVTVRGTEAAITVAALDVDRYLSGMGPWTIESTRSALSGPTGDIIIRLLTSVGFEDPNRTVIDDVAEYTAWFSRKWNSGVDTLFDFLTHSGLTVSGTFTGEDDAQWAYSTGENGELLEDTLLPVLQRVYVRMEHAVTLADQVQALARDTDGDAALGAAIRALLSAAPS
jgi:hypothetical protein